MYICMCIGACTCIWILCVYIYVFVNVYIVFLDWLFWLNWGNVHHVFTMCYNFQKAGFSFNFSYCTIFYCLKNFMRMYNLYKSNTFFVHHAQIEKTKILKVPLGRDTDPQRNQQCWIAKALSFGLMFSRLHFVCSTSLLISPFALTRFQALVLEGFDSC